MNNSILMTIKLFFVISSRIIPFVAVRAAEKLFTTPFHSKRRDIEYEILESAERFFIPMGKHRQLTGYRWGRKTDPVILFVHGWTSTATCFVNFINPLLAKGYQVIAYDSIAHGETSGFSVSMTEWADTVIAVMKVIGKVHCIVGHSLGSGAIVIASSLELNTDKLILISPVADITKVTDQFAKALSIPERIMEKMHEYAWKKYFFSASKYGDNWNDVFESNFKVPTLLIHDIDDHEIDISNARKLAKQWSWSELIETKRLGHRRILINPDVITASLKFVMEPDI
jgi:pimeloyl-ACP methyl ester carboxylesterase